MLDQQRDWPLVSVVIVTYNRSDTLAVTIRSLLGCVDYPRDRLELVITDDGSDSDHLSRISAMPHDQLVSGGPRSGMGANTNRGLAAATGDYVLQLQDDWDCTARPGFLKDAVTVLESEPDVGFLLLNFNPNTLPVRRQQTVSGMSVRVLDNQTAAPILSVNDGAYSDWPHLKRRSVLNDIGPYLESKKMWETELDYSRRVAAQTRWFVADMPGLRCFEHIGEEQSFNWPLKKRLYRMIVTIPGGNAVWLAYRKSRMRLFKF